ncbi:MAG: hypothetical protein JNL73_14945 [Anaerolineales bacterium]|nr:hypothetical protein [Anaerolineales bacterium]
MHPVLSADHAGLDALLALARDTAAGHLAGLSRHPVGRGSHSEAPHRLSADGVGARAALEEFQTRFAAGLTGSAGPRYWGFVTGGSTPAALVGDWLASAYDQNAAGKTEPATAQVEREAITLLRDLLGLSDAHNGLFVSGATLSNVVGLALGRQWVGAQLGIDVAVQGVGALPSTPVFSGVAHASISKALSIIGLGRAALQAVPARPGRESVDLAALEDRLAALAGRPAIVVANAGTVNTGDFDDLAAIAALRERYPFWLHIDAAFGGFAACAPGHAHLVTGLDAADSLCVDAHKWLNVPYDSAMQFTRHKDLQAQVFQNSAAYLGALGDDPDALHLTPENSRRWRALPAWFTLKAYGAAGYRDIVERCCALAQDLGRRLADSADFELLAPVRLNVVCFTPTGEVTAERVAALLQRLRDGGEVFLTPTVYAGRPAIRAAFSNWRTTADDVSRAWAALTRAVDTANSNQ